MNRSIFITIIALCISGSLAQEFGCPPTGDASIPHPDTCYKFILCHNGVGHEMDCPGGLHWNPTEEICDWPDTANCVIDGPDTGDCPSTDVADSPIFFPNPLLCNRFYMCCSGSKISMYCGNNFHWNEETNFCDFPVNAQCDYDSDLNIDPDCPASGLHWLPHPDSCAHFFICYGGQGTLQRCAANLYWSVITETCDIPDNVTCDVECPETGLSWLPHPQSCHHYFMCLNGESDLLTCAPGLNWDPINNRCDFEDNNVCQI